jgi:hypothetical protein
VESGQRVQGEAGRHAQEMTNDKCQMTNATTVSVRW